MSEVLNKLNEYARAHRWAALMYALPLGSTEVLFDKAESIRSFRSVAYDYNSYRREFTFSVKEVDKQNRTATITKSKRDEN